MIIHNSISLPQSHPFFKIYNNKNIKIRFYLYYFELRAQHVACLSKIDEKN